MNIIKTNLGRNPEYYEQTINLIETAFNYSESNSFESDFAPLVHPLNHQNLHILIEDDQVVAHIGIRLRDFGHQNLSSPVALIGGIAIKDSHRGQGLFKSFFEEIIELYKDKVSLLFLWSDLDSLYKKFNFYQTGGIIQTGERIFLESDVDNQYTKYKANEITDKDFSRLKDLYSLYFEKNHTSLLRDDFSWSLIKDIKSTDFYVFKKNNKIESYFCVGKGQDLEHIIHEFVANPIVQDEVEEFVNQFRLWLPLAENEKYQKSKVLFSCFMKIGNENLFKELINNWFTNDLYVFEINDNEVYFEFKNEEFTLPQQDFLTSVFGPSQVKEFSTYSKPLFISGLDSI